MIATLAFLAIAGTPERFLMAHMMPWYESQPVSGKWGWHWTMNHFDPDRGEAASHYRPKIGLYDSGDPYVIEYQLLTMKLAGFDGVLVDWYGIGQLYDYPVCHRNTQRIFEATKRFGMKFAVVYEDQTLPNLIREKKLPADQAVEHGKETLRWLDEHWFNSPNYLRYDGKPVFLVFGPQFYKPADWAPILASAKTPPAFLSLHFRRDSALGAYDWPVPLKGTEGCEDERLKFLSRSEDWPVSFAAAYPRFHDIYKDAKVSDGYPEVLDRNGETYRHTLTEALIGNAPVVQVATWNDWGEGTQIEPSVEFGYRDLEATQQLLAKYWKRSVPSSADLTLPYRLYQRRIENRANPAAEKRLDEIAGLLGAGKTAQAAKALRIP